MTRKKYSEDEVRQIIWDERLSIIEAVIGMMKGTSPTELLRLCAVNEYIRTRMDRDEVRRLGSLPPLTSVK